MDAFFGSPDATIVGSSDQVEEVLVIDRMLPSEVWKKTLTFGVVPLIQDTAANCEVGDIVETRGGIIPAVQFVYTLFESDPGGMHFPLHCISASNPSPGV